MHCPCSSRDCVTLRQYPTKGVYNCAGCGQALYNYDSKFKSGCGWPAFFEEIPGTVDRIEDRTFGMLRTEIVCSNCGGHLGESTLFPSCCSPFPFVARPTVRPSSASPAVRTQTTRLTCQAHTACFQSPC